MRLNRKPLKTIEDEMRLIQTPRKKPLPVPLVGVFDEPYKLILVNREWWSHVSGMIDVLSSLDAWTGDIDEKTHGIREIAKLLSTDWEEGMVQDIRINSDTYLLEKMVAGEWLPVENFDLFFDYTQAIQAKADDAWLFAYDLMQTTFHESVYEGGDVGFTADSPLKLYIDSMAGTPFDPSALEAAIAEAQADADAAAAAAAAAQVSANLADSNATNANLAANAAQITANTANTTANASQITNVTQSNQISAIHTRLDKLEYGGFWTWLHNFSVSQQGYSLGAEGSYSAGIGFRSNSNGLEIVYTVEQIKQNQIEWLQCEVLYNSAPTGTPLWRVNGQNNAIYQYNGVGVSSFGWYQLPPSDQDDLTIEFAGSGDFYLLSMRYLGKGTNLPFD